jgi:Family of unknown function (DUF6152)
MEQSTMPNRRLRIFSAALGCLIVSIPSLAHHANAVFDTGKKVTMKGTVTEWFWANPHCLLRFDVRGDNGEVVHWTAETQAPPNIIPSGYSKQSFKPGDEITITVEPVKNGQPLGRVLQVVLPNGKTLGGPVGGAGGAADAPKP